MLLFFDGVAVLAAPAEHDLLTAGQEETIYPLHDAHFLHILDPDDIIDQPTARALINFVLELATSEEEESLRLGRSLKDRGILHHRWSQPRALDNQERTASLLVWKELQRRGLASDFRPDDAIYVESNKWRQILAFLAQAIRPAGWRIGLDLQPATDDPSMIHNFPAAQGRSPLSEGDVVTFDIEQVAVDMSDVPISDLLEFRESHGRDYRTYARSIQKFALEVSALPLEDRASVFLRRRDELADEADHLRNLARTWWRQPAASVGLGLIGAGVSASAGQWASAVLAMLTGIVGAKSKPSMAGIYSYLFKAQERFPHDAIC
jgi:hypothetical protein